MEPRGGSIMIYMYHFETSEEYYELLYALSA
jgi:hypothetical protein